MHRLSNSFCSSLLDISKSDFHHWALQTCLFQGSWHPKSKFVAHRLHPPSQSNLTTRSHKTAVTYSDEVLVISPLLPKELVDDSLIKPLMGDVVMSPLRVSWERFRHSSASCSLLFPKGYAQCHFGGLIVGLEIDIERCRRSRLTRTQRRVRAVQVLSGRHATHRVWEPGSVSITNHSPAILHLPIHLPQLNRTRLKRHSSSRSPPVLLIIDHKTQPG